MPARQKFTNADDYINSFSGEVKQRLQDLRKFIKKLLPDSEEVISYGIPTFKQNGSYVVYFAGFKNHISIYPFPSAVSAFAELTKGYKTAKGTIQFPHNEPLPFDLIEKIVEFKLKENEERTK